MRILVTAGPTREYFDSVRFISNPSTGKMGYAVAAEVVRRGHDVYLVSGPVQLPDPIGACVTRVVSAREMFEASISLFEKCRAAVMTAAVCDYRPAARLDRKLEKKSLAKKVELEPTEDICAHLGLIKGDRVVIGFALEDHDHHVRAEDKLRRKRCDAIVLGGIGNIAGEDAEIEVFTADGGWSPPRVGTKAEIASVLVDLLEELVGDRG